MPAPLPALLALALAAQAAAPPPAAPEPPPPTLAPSPADAGPAGPGNARRYVVEKIRIDGLSHVRESEVRRRISIRDGEVLDEERVLLSRLRLLQLGWFSRVETRVERGSERGLVVVVFSVSERNTLLLTDLVLAGTDVQPLYGGFGLSQQNFLGRGLGLSGAFVYAGPPRGRPDDHDLFAARVSFFAPDVEVPGVKGGLVFGASAIALRGIELACGDPDCAAYHHAWGAAPAVLYERVGADATVGFRPGPFERIHGTFRYEWLDASRSGSPAPAGAEPPILMGKSNLAALIGTWELDTRDDFFLPREGIRALAQVTFSSRLLGSDYEYSRYRLDLDTAYSLLGLPLRFQSTVGAAQGDAPFFDRFYGADYSYFAVGPALARALELNFSSDSRYDAFVAMAGLEYAVPLWAKSGFFRRGYLAVGARGVYSTATLGGSRTAFSKTPLSGDLALRLDTPVGMFNVSVAYWLDIFL